VYYCCTKYGFHEAYFVYYLVPDSLLHVKTLNFAKSGAGFGSSQMHGDGIEMYTLVQSSSKTTPVTPGQAPSCVEMHLLWQH
jgi:hypothetical protein